ncbi:putative caldesmon-like isoform 2 [Scophthalmus maximus]|uniref:Putative caldesmon-like isoform 2 n=1 Tax=Scophthalmus maximus TaxID=52904 RepID=A0A2U9B212_SCOMX|nr:putative caldesmon-like isoform 2 [Scophthalmus maximus]
MEEMDFERRRELRRQKREEMRLEAERLARNDDDEEEAARERRRRARQERLRGREGEEPSGQPDNLVITNSHSVTETVSVSSSCGGGGEEEDQALLDRMAMREERRQRRMQEALERQKQMDPTVTEDNGSVAAEKNNEEEERPSSWRRGRYRDNEEEEEKTSAYSSRREEKQREEPREEGETPPEGGEEPEEGVDEEEEEEFKEEVVEDKPRRSYLREQDLAEDEAHSVVSESSTQAASANSEAEEDAVESGETEEVPEDDNVDNSPENKPLTFINDTGEDNEVSQILHSEDNEVSSMWKTSVCPVLQVNERGGAREEREEQRKQNGGLHEEAAPNQHRKPERTLSRGSVRSPEVSAGDDQDDDARLEAELKLEELKRRRDDAESEEFEKMRHKQLEAEAELEELKRKREDRRKVLEEEERQKKQEEMERKTREEEEKRKMKEEIERRRAEAAEKRQKVDDVVDGDDKPFKCVSPRGSSLKIGERAEFLNKSAQKSSTVKAAHSTVVSKIDNRLEQYTSAAQRENKESRSPRSGAVDLPMVTDSIRNIKSMWEKGNVFGSPGSGGNTFKEAAVMKTGVAGRINDWLNKTPESGKASGGRPADLKPVDVTNKRSLWENKGASPTKVAGRGETKSVANGMGH